MLVIRLFPCRAGAIVQEFKTPSVQERKRPFAIRLPAEHLFPDIAVFGVGMPVVRASVLDVELMGGNRLVADGSDPVDDILGGGLVAVASVVATV